MFGWYRTYEAEPFGAKWEKPVHWICRRRGRRMTEKGGLQSASTSVGVGSEPALDRRTVGEQSPRWLSLDGHPDRFEPGSFGKP